MEEIKIADEWNDKYSMLSEFVNRMAKRVNPKGNRPCTISLDTGTLRLGTEILIHQGNGGDQ